MKSLDMTIFLVLLLGVFTLFSDGQSVSDGNRTQKFGNGCLLTNTVVDDVPFKRYQLSRRVSQKPFRVLTSQCFTVTCTK